MSNPSERLFDELYSAHLRTLHAYFLGKTGDSELSPDLVQDAFMRLWRNLGSVADLSPDRQRAWLFSVARNLVIDQYRAEATRRATRAALALEAASAPVESPSAAAAVAEKEQLQIVDGAIGRLPEGLRMVLVLQLVGERNSSEIGEFLGRPAGTVRYQLAEARRRLAGDPQLRELRNQ